MVMAQFDPAGYASSVAALVSESRLMALDAGRPNQAVLEQLSALDEGRLLDGHAARDRDMARACLAGLWLLHDFLEESQRISQGLHGREGSYWHGILHRREGDYPNAKYWFRRVGAHPIHETLKLRARGLLRGATEDAALLRSQNGWDPSDFVDLCEAACAGGNGAAESCRKIQQQEWQLLFDFCYRRALGQR
jgi:hypothetical protein